MRFAPSAGVGGHALESAMGFRPAAFQFVLPPQCPCCGKFLEEGQQGFCSNCLSEIHWIKPPFFAEWMAEGLNRYWEPDSLDLLIPVPLHPQRLRERGFNQALLLAKELSRRTGIPYFKTILKKKKPTPPQVNLSGVEREKGLRGAFHVVEKEELLGRSVLLVDDVYTTGATVNECSKVLVKGGAGKVDVLTLAHELRAS